MDPHSLLNRLIDFYHAYPIIVIGLGVLILIWAYLRPKQVLRGGLFLCFVIAVFYLVSLMGAGTDSSLSTKKQMMNKTEKALAE